MRADRILVLGGTEEARDLVLALLDQGHDVITSLAGVTTAPILPKGVVRQGGFGGVAGLVQFMDTERIAAIADATHPFAAQMSRQAYAAAQEAGIKYVRLERPPWTAESGDRWIGVESIAEAASILPDGARVLLTTGRKDVALFTERPTISGVARMIEPPSLRIPDTWTLILARPPFTVKDEQHLINRHAISHVVAKNSGGSATYAKVVAARQAELPVVMVHRPKKPGGPGLSEIDDIVTRLGRVLSP